MWKAAGLAVLAAGLPASALAAPCPGAPVRETVRAAGPDGELETVSGRTLRLADIRIPDPARDAVGGRPETGAWLRSLAGQGATVLSAGAADRWGREPAVVLLDDGTARTDVAELLVGEGLALVDAGEAESLCRPELWAREAVARSGRLGLWGRLPLPATDPDALRALAGRFVVLEGRVVSVGERKARTYLNFGRDFSRDVAVVIPRRSWARLKAAGASAASLTGRTVRARGIVEVRRAPSIEVVAPEMLDWQDPR